MLHNIRLPKNSIIKFISGGAILGAAGSLPDDPSSIDPGNIILLLDGDLNLNTSTWQNQVGAMANMVFEPAGVSVNATGLNGHGIVLFDGVFGANTGKGTITTPVLNLSGGTSYTTYFCFKINGVVGNRFVFDDGVMSVRHKMQQSAYWYVITGGAIVPTGAPFTVGQWVILSATIVNGVGNSSVRDYVEGGVDSGRIAGTLNTTVNPAGITIAGATTNFGQCNCDYSYVMFRSGADSLATQNQIFDAFKNRFAI